MFTACHVLRLIGKPPLDHSGKSPVKRIKMARPSVFKYKRWGFSSLVSASFSVYSAVKILEKSLRFMSKFWYLAEL